MTKRAKGIDAAIRGYVIGIKADNERLRAALVSIADKTQYQETNLEMLLGEIYDAACTALLSVKCSMAAPDKEC